MSTFTKIPSLVGEMLAAGQIKPLSLATFYGLAKFADNETGECWPSRAQIAKAAGYSKADAVDDHLKALEAAGAISVHRRGYRSKTEPYTYSAVRDDEHPVRATSVYRLAGFGGAPESRGTPTPEFGGTRTPEPGVVTRPTQLDPPEPDSEIEVRSSGDDPPTPIPNNWHPNGIHVNAAKRHGIHCTEAAEVFKRWANRTGSKRSNWNAEFGHFLAATVDEHDERYGGLEDRYWQLVEIGYDLDRLPIHQTA